MSHFREILKEVRQRRALMRYFLHLKAEEIERGISNVKVEDEPEDSVTQKMKELELLINSSEDDEWEHENEEQGGLEDEEKQDELDFEIF